MNTGVEEAKEEEVVFNGEWQASRYTFTDNLITMEQVFEKEHKYWIRWHSLLNSLEEDTDYMRFIDNVYPSEEPELTEGMKRANYLTREQDQAVSANKL